MGTRAVCGHSRTHSDPTRQSDLMDLSHEFLFRELTLNQSDIIQYLSDPANDEIVDDGSLSESYHEELILPNFISDLRDDSITFEVSFEHVERPNAASTHRFQKLPPTTFFIATFADEESLINEMQVYFQEFFETTEYKLDIHSPDFTTLPHVLCLKFPQSTSMHVTYSVIPNRKIYKRELPMQSLDFSNLDFFDDKERPMELVEAIMKKRNLTAKLVDIILSFSHSCEICKIIQPALLGECGGCSKTFHQCHVCETIVCTSCHRFGDCCHSCKNFRCYLCSLKKKVRFKQCMFCSASMADFSTVFDHLDSDSETSEVDPDDGGPVGGSLLQV